MGQRGGSITLAKPADPQAVASLSDMLAALFRMPPDKLFFLMSGRNANEMFDPAVFDDWFHRLSPKISAFLLAEDAMRRDDGVAVAAPIADAAVSVWPLDAALNAVYS